MTVLINLILTTDNLSLLVRELKACYDSVIGFWAFKCGHCGYYYNLNIVDITLVPLIRTDWCQQIAITKNFVGTYLFNLVAALTIFRIPLGFEIQRVRILKGYSCTLVRDVSWLVTWLISRMSTQPNTWYIWIHNRDSCNHILMIWHHYYAI